MIKQVSLNSLWLLSGRILALGLNVIFVAILARRLRADAFGEYALYASIVYLGNFFTTYGTDVLLIREIAREGAMSDKVLSSLGLQLLLSCVWILVVSGLGAFWTHDIRSFWTLFLFNLSLLPLSFQSIYNSILRALERMNIYALLNLLAIFVQAISAYFLIHSSSDLSMLAFLVFFCQAFMSLIGYVCCRDVFPALKFPDEMLLKEIWLLLRSGWKLALLAPLAALFQRLNLFLLSFVLGAATAGLYSAASRLVEGIKIGHFSVSNSLMPSMARPATSKQASTINFSFSFLLLLSLFFALCLSVFAAPIIKMLYGISYEASASLLRIIGWMLIPYTFSVYFSLRLTMNGLEASVLKANLFILPCAALLSFLLMKELGVVGSAWGVLINESMFAFLLFLIYRYSFRRI
jgi:O-antigen/teichoic acid export membrane protein